MITGKWPGDGILRCRMLLNFVRQNNERIYSYDSLLILSTIVISKPLDHSKLTRIPPGYFLIMCRLYVKSILNAPLFTEAVFFI